MRNKNETFFVLFLFAVLREFMGQPRVAIIQEGTNFAGNISPGNSVVLGCKPPMGDGNNKAYVGRQGKIKLVSLFGIAISINFFSSKMYEVGHATSTFIISKTFVISYFFLLIRNREKCQPNWFKKSWVHQ